MVNSECLVRDVFMIGGSAGGIEAVIEVLRRLPPSLPITLGIALHRNPAWEGNLKEVLARASPLRVLEPADGDAVQAGVICLAPRDQHLLLDDGHWRVNRTPKVHYTRPAVDPLFMSAAQSRQKQVVGILLSGTGGDGVVGLITIKGAGGLSIVQDPSEASHPSMPMRAIREDDVDAVLRCAAVAAAILALAMGKSFTP